jgi:endonuclease-3
MAISNRAAIYDKIDRILKKHYKPVVPPVDYSVLQYALYACCLENAHYDHADEAYSKVMQTYFDLNEIRVTTVGELSELMRGLPDPSAAAMRLRQVLQNVFESCYSFDIDSMRKQNIGKAIELLEKYQATPFVVSYVTQQGLAGHSIPKDAGVLQALYIVGAITAAEAKQGTSPGLERTISKNKGSEFSSLLHQLGADVFKTPRAPAVRAILLEIDPAAKERLPKRKTKKKEVKLAAKDKTQKKVSTPSKKAGEKAVEKKATTKKVTTKKVTAKKVTAKKATTKKATTKKATTKKATTKKAIAKKATAKKATTKKATTKKATAKKATAKKTSPQPAEKKTTSRRISKRKPK